MWQNENHVDNSYVLAQHPEVRLFRAENYNAKYHGRFMLPLMMVSALAFRSVMERQRKVGLFTLC